MISRKPKEAPPAAAGTVAPATKAGARRADARNVDAAKSTATKPQTAAPKAASGKMAAPPPAAGKSAAALAAGGKATIGKAAIGKAAVGKAFMGKTVAGRLSSDLVLGAGGCCLAAASAAFGIGMSMHGPDSSLGKSKDFTVFAQLSHRGDRPAYIGSNAARRGTTPEAPAEANDLDMTATASIPEAGATTLPSPRVVLPTVRVETADRDSATIWVAGKSQVFRVGDAIPGAGTVLEIENGTRPLVRTSEGVIVSEMP